MKRYCVAVVSGYWFSGNDTSRQYESHYFDSFDEAERYRKMMKRSGREVTNVCDLEDLPF